MCTVALGATAGLSFAQNLVQNGSFETGYYGANGVVFDPLHSDSTTLADWTVTNTSDVHLGRVVSNNKNVTGTGIYRVGDGNQSISVLSTSNSDGFDGATEGQYQICQTITGLEVGAKYELTFMQGTNGGGTNLVQDTNWIVQFGNETQESTLMHKPLTTQWFSSTGTFIESANPETMIFTATSTEQELCFLNSALGGPTWLTLDGVSLEKISVPEPALTLFFAFGSIGFLTRRQRKHQ